MKHHNPKSLPIYALRYKSVREVTVCIYITGVSESLLCGSGAGILSKMIIYPLDIIKKRLEIQGFEKARTDCGSVRHYMDILPLGCLFFFVLRILITPLVFSNSSYIFMCTSINGIDDENNNKKKQKIGHTNLQQK